MIGLVLLPLLFGLFYRFRGGAFSFKYWLGKKDEKGEHYGGTFWARLIWWGLPNAMFMASLVPGWNSVAVFAAMWLAAYLALLVPHAEFQDFNKKSDFYFMSAVGALRGIICALPLVYFTDSRGFWLAAFGALTGVAYWIGYNVMQNLKAPILTGKAFSWFPFFPEQWKKDIILWYPTSWGETLTGVFWGTGLVLLQVLYQN